MTRHGLVALLLASQVALALAQSPPEGVESGTSQKLSVSTPPAFTLKIDAPDDIKLLLSNHLELQRYQALTDLSDDELDRLTDQAQQDARQLIGTLGYFSPSITLERLPSNNVDGGPVVKMTVLPGEATRVTQVQIRFNGAIATEEDAMAQRNTIQTSWSLQAGSRFTQAAWDSAKQQALRQRSVW